MIRAGENAEAIDSMRHAGLIGLRYRAVANATEWTSDQIDKALTDEGHPGQVAQLRTALLWFAKDAKVGDLVVSPNIARREVWLGVIIGDYTYSEEPVIAEYGHTRAVDWMGWLDRDAEWMRGQLKSIEQPPVMFELYSRDWWWNHVGSHALSMAPRLRQSKPPSAAKSSTPRAPRAPRPSANPRPKVTPPVLCAGSCGLVWSPFVLVGGLCADCRNN